VQPAPAARRQGHARRQGRRRRRAAQFLDLKLNPHFHALLLDGVFRSAEGAIPVFTALPRLSTSDVANVLQTVRTWILGYLVRQGVVVADPEASWIDAGPGALEPALAQLAAAAVSGLPPAGPELRRRPPIPLRGRPGVVVTSPLAVGVVEAGSDITWSDTDLGDGEPVLAQLAAAAVSGRPPAGPELQIPLRGRPSVVISAPLSVAELGPAQPGGAGEVHPAPAACRRTSPPSSGHGDLTWG
jgi:hypothetical protein